MNIKYFVWLVSIILYTASCSGASRFRQFIEGGKKIAATKVFNYGGGTLLTGASLYYLNEKINNLKIKKRLAAELRINPLMLQQIREMTTIGSKVIFCDTYASIEKICANRVAQALFESITRDPSPQTERSEKLRKKITQITLENTKQIAKQGLKQLYLESTEKQKLFCLFSAFFSALITTRAIASMGENMRAGKLFFRSNVALATLITTSTLIGSILLDEEKIITLAAHILKQNESTIIPIFEQLAYEGKEFTLETLKKRDAIILLCFKKGAFDRAMKKIELLPMKNIDTLIHRPEFKIIVEDFFADIIDLLYQYTQQQESFVHRAVGHIVFGSNEPWSKKFLVNAANYITQRQEQIAPKLGTTPSYEQLLDFPYDPTFLDMLYDFFTKKEFDSSCQPEESVIIEEVTEERVD